MSKEDYVHELVCCLSNDGKQAAYDLGGDLSEEVRTQIEKLNKQLEGIRAIGRSLHAEGYRSSKEAKAK